MRLIVPLTIAVWQEAGHWLSECVELEIGSFGDNPNDAAAQAMDAVCSYLNTLEELGERERVFEERGIQVIVAPTAAWHPEVSGEIASRPDVQTLSRRRSERPTEEHLDLDCPDIWACGKSHRIMSSAAEADLFRYPNEWVLLDRREGVKYHGGNAAEIYAIALAEIGRDACFELVLYRVPDPNVGYYF